MKAILLILFLCCWF